MIKEIVTHGSPVHLDELVARLLLRDHGEEKLPGVNNASFRTIRPGEDLAALAKREDVVLLGLGGGPFDEHAPADDPAKQGECCATLVAKWVGQDETIEWSRILRYVRHTDRNPPNLTLDLAPTVIRLQKQGWGLEAVLGYAEIAIKVARTDQLNFAKTSLQNIDEAAVMIKGEPHWIAVIKNGEPDSPRLARFFGAAVVVVQNPTGHIQVLSTNHLHLDLRDVLRLLRSEEGRVQRRVIVTDWKQLEEEETIPNLPEWFFHKETNNILNGGFSRPDIPPTKLPLQRVVELVQIGLDEQRFEPLRRKQCQAGQCVSSREKPCPWYQGGLIRCRTIRYRMWVPAQGV